MITPCINICKLDNSGLCNGCFRTVEEITNWTKYTDAKRLEIIKILEERKNGRNT